MPAAPAHPAPAAISSRAVGIAFAAVGAIGFSGKAIIVKLAYRYGVDAITLLMYRMLMALPFFLLMAWWGGRGRPALRRDERWAVLGLGFCGYYLASMLDFVGLRYITAGLERLILYLTPTLVLLYDWAWRGRAITPGHVLATVVSYGGALLVFGFEAHAAPGGATARGALWVLGSAAAYALYLFFSGEYVRRIGALRLVGLASTVASLCCIGHFALVNPLSAARVAEPVLWLSLLNATLCTAAPVLLVMLGVERIGASLAAQVGMIGPLSTIAMSVALLGEPFTPGLAAGTVLVVAGIALFSRAGQARPAAG